MAFIDKWRLASVLTVYEAALLSEDLDPDDFLNGDGEFEFGVLPGAVRVVSKALMRALEAREIEGLKMTVAGQGPSEALSTVKVVSLREWLSDRGVRGGFFFPDGSDVPPYLDQAHPRYSNRLAAAIAVWTATASSGEVSGRSPKQQIVAYLEMHATQLGLVDDEGRVSEGMIEAIAKVVNWQPGGGAPRTPGS